MLCVAVGLGGRSHKIWHGDDTVMTHPANGDARKGKAAVAFCSKKKWVQGQSGHLSTAVMLYVAVIKTPSPRLGDTRTELCLPVERVDAVAPSFDGVVAARVCTRVKEAVEEAPR